MSESFDTNISTQHFEIIIVQSDQHYEDKLWAESFALDTLQSENFTQQKIEVLNYEQNQWENSQNRIVDQLRQVNGWNLAQLCLKKIQRKKQRSILKLLGLLDFKEVYQKLKSLGRGSNDEISLLSSWKQRQGFKKMLKSKQIKATDIDTRIVSKIQVLKARLGPKYCIAKRL